MRPSSHGALTAKASPFYIMFILIVSAVADPLCQHKNYWKGQHKHDATRDEVITLVFVVVVVVLCVFL